MRCFAKSLLVLTGCSVLALSSAGLVRGEDDIQLMSFEEPVPVVSQQSMSLAAPVQAPIAAPSTPRFAARPALAQAPYRPAIQPRGQRPMRRASKPFENVERDPTISPYLYLDRDDDEREDIPSYFTMVRPRQEQLETNRVQQRELLHLRGQVQGLANPTVMSQPYQPYRAGASSSARFMDTAQFYGNGR